MLIFFVNGSRIQERSVQSQRKTTDTEFKEWEDARRSTTKNVN